MNDYDECFALEVLQGKCTQLYLKILNISYLTKMSYFLYKKLFSKSNILDPVTI